MNIITPKGIFDTEKDAIALLFNNDDELSNFISLIVKTPIRSTGVRVVTLINEYANLTPLQVKLLDIIQGLDGVGGADNDEICDSAIDKINDILES